MEPSAVRTPCSDWTPLLSQDLDVITRLMPIVKHLQTTFAVRGASSWPGVQCKLVVVAAVWCGLSSRRRDNFQCTLANTSAFVSIINRAAKLLVLNSEDFH